MNAYNYCGVTYSGGDRVKVQFLGDKDPLNGKSGTVIKAVSGGLKVRFGNVALGYEIATIHPSKLQKVVA